MLPNSPSCCSTVLNRKVPFFLLGDCKWEFYSAILEFFVYLGPAVLNTTFDTAAPERKWIDTVKTSCMWLHKTNTSTSWKKLTMLQPCAVLGATICAIVQWLSVCNNTTLWTITRKNRTIFYQLGTHLLGLLFHICCLLDNRRGLCSKLVFLYYYHASSQMRSQWIKLCKLQSWQAEYDTSFLCLDHWVNEWACCKDISTEIKRWFPLLEQDIFG